MTSESPHDLLPWFVTGKLSAEETAEFREHLASCEECRSGEVFLSKARDLVDLHGEAFLSEHPDSKTLVAFAREELEGSKAEPIREHVALCSTCEQEVGWVRGSVPFELPSPTPRSGLSYRWVAAIAAMMLVGVLGLSQIGRNSSSVHWVRPQLLAAPERSLGDLPEIVLGPDSDRWSIYFTVDLDEDGYPARIELLDGDGNVRGTETVHDRQGLVADEFQFLECVGCPSGEYSVVIAPASGATQSIPFRVVQAP